MLFRCMQYNFIPFYFYTFSYTESFLIEDCAFEEKMGERWKINAKRLIQLLAVAPKAPRK